MKFRKCFTISILAYSKVLIILGITSPTKNSYINALENKNPNETFTEEISPLGIKSLFSENVEIKGVHTDNFNTLVFGRKSHLPYISVINSKQDEILFDSTINSKTGSIVDVYSKGIYYEGIIDSENSDITTDFFITKNNIIPYHKKQLTINYTKNRTIKPKYLVIHETDNTRAGADANAHYRYWSTNTSANASTHFVVDSKEIYQLLELNQMAWHVGDNRGYSDITNSNSIGIEIAVNSDGDYELTRSYTIDLARRIMNELDMNIDQLKTHNDASGKNCPRIMLRDNRWNDFKEQVNQGLKKYV